MTTRSDRDAKAISDAIAAFRLMIASIRKRFPGPWRADKIPEGYVVTDNAGARLAYVYAPPASVASAIPVRSLTNAEARAIARAIAALSEA